MAIDFPSLGQGWLNLGSAVLSATPITMFCWVRPATANINYALINIERTQAQGFADFEMYSMETAPTGQIYAYEVGPGFTSEFASAGTFSADTWTAAGAVFTDHFNRRAWCNGVGGTANTNEVFVPTVGDTNFGARNTGSNTFRNTVGCMAHAAIWNRALDDQEMEDLGTGVKIPSDIPDGLVLYCPMVDMATAGDNLIGTDLTANNTIATCATSPPLVPGSPRFRSYTRIIGF